MVKTASAQKKLNWTDKEEIQRGITSAQDY